MKKKNSVKISNDFINLPLQLDARGFDMILYVALKLQSFQKKEDLYLINITRKELIEHLNLNKDISYGSIDKVIYKLNNSKLEYFSEDYTYISNLFIDYERIAERMSIRISERMASLFLNLKNNYTIADLYIVASFKSIFSKRIYLFILQYQNFKTDRVMALSEFRTILKIEDKYLKKQHLKDRVLDVAKKEINNLNQVINFDYNLQYAEDKITFLFNKNYKTETEQEQPQEQPTKQFEKQVIYVNQYNEVLPQNPNFKPPTKEEIVTYAEMTGKFIDAEAFINYYNSQGWLKANGMPITNWQSLVNSWAAKQSNEEYERAVKLCNDVTNSNNNNLKYDEVHNKLLSCNIDNIKFAKALVDEKKEHLFNFDNSKFYNEDEFKEKFKKSINVFERYFILIWDKYQ